jgi:DNA polymerase
MEWKSMNVRQYNQFVQEIIANIKSYLESLKGMGIDSLPLSTGEREQGSPTLEEVRKALGDCRRCKLHRTRRTLVFGEGNKKAELMIIGEGPGFEEDVQGRPFVGKAGQLLTNILLSIHLQREEVYITNIIKCRPPQNRNPEPDEIQSCYPFLLKQIQAIQPQTICALGTFAAQTLLKTDAKITTLRGKFYEFTPLERPAPLAESRLRDRKGEAEALSFLTGFAGIKVFPTYHPAYLLRNPERKREVWEDMKQIAKWIVNSDHPSQPVGEKRR